MNEKVPTLTSQDDQAEVYSAEKEMTLLDLLEVTYKKKTLIFNVVTLFLLISIVYAWTVNPIYQATIGFLEPQETYLSQFPPEIAKNLPGWTSFNSAGEVIQINSSVFSRFLSKMGSYGLKKEVFEKGGFKNKFYSDIDPADLDHAVLELHNSINMVDEEVVKGPIKIKKDRLVYFNMEGANPEAMAEFLTVLAETTKQNIIVETNDQAKSGIKTKIKQISREIADLRLKAEKKRESELKAFSSALGIAKSLGIKNNNFSKMSNSKFNFENSKKDSWKYPGNRLPDWFLYGEQALHLEKQVLESRKAEDMFEQELIDMELELKLYQSIDLLTIIPKVYILSQPSIPPAHPIKAKKRLIIAMGAMLGLIFGIFVAFLSDMIEQRNKKQTTSSDI